MKIELEEPFKSKWNNGYLQTHPNKRNYVVLFNTHSDRKITSYARYLMGVKLGYFVPDHLEVDHIDDDKTNDDINNLQLLTGEENRLKQEYNYVMNQQISYGYECAYCDGRFILTQREVNMRLAQNVEMAFCSRSCSTNYHRYISKTNTIGTTLGENEIHQIKQLRSQGLSSYKISEITGYARNTVMKYW